MIFFNIDFLGKCVYGLKNYRGKEIENISKKTGLSGLNLLGRRVFLSRD